MHPFAAAAVCKSTDQAGAMPPMCLEEKMGNQHSMAVVRRLYVVCDAFSKRPRNTIACDE